MRIIILFASLMLSSIMVQASSETALLPDVKQVLIIPDIDEKAMDNNAYVSLYVLDGPKGADTLSVAKKILLKNNQLLQQAIKNNSKSLLKQFDSPENYFGKDYQLEFVRWQNDFPCGAIKNYDCVKIILNNKTQLMQLVEQNHILLARYQNVLKLPNYDVYAMHLETLYAPYHYVVFLSQLRLGQAIIAIDEGRIEEGLIILQQEVNFAKNKLLVSGYLIDYAIGLRNLNVIYTVIAGLLDNQQMMKNLNNPLLVELIQPLNKQEQQSFVGVLKKERQFGLLSFNFTSTEDLEKIINDYNEFGIDELSYEYLRQAKKLGYPLQFDKHLAMNLTYQRFDALIDEAALTLPTSSMQYIASKRQSKSILTIQQLYEKYGGNNLLSGIFLERDTYAPYLYRLYDLNNYLWLINTKLQIKQAAITKEQTPEFLIKLGNKAKNPYSQQPFKWDANNQILSSDWLSEYADTERDGERASVYIQFD